MIFNKNKTKELAGSLRSLNLEPLDARDIQNAQTRVLNQLHHSIQTKENEKKIMEGIEKPQRRFAFMQTNAKYIAIGSIIGLFLFTSSLGIGYTTYRFTRPRQTAQVNQNDDIKALAAARFKTLNGVEYSELESLNKAGTGMSATTEGSQTKSRTSDSFGASTLPESNITRAKELEKNIDIENSKVFYNEQEIRIAENTSGSIQNPALGGLLELQSIKNVDGVDFGKPFLMQTWYSPSYSKNKISQNGKTLSLTTTTPEFYIQYMGGKYAVQVNYSERMPFYGYMQGEVGNPEVMFLKSILSNESPFKKQGTKMIDGKELTMFELAEQNFVEPLVSDSNEISRKPFSSTARPKEVYYVDVKDFSLKLRELYEGERLIASYKTTDTKEFVLKDIKPTFADTNDLSTTEIKKFTQKVSSNDPSVPYTRERIANFMKDKRLYYVEGVPLKIEYVSSIYINEDERRLAEALNSKGFNPSFENREYEANTLEGTYMQSGISFSIHKNEPKINTINEKKSPITITIEGKKIEAALLDLTKGDPGLPQSSTEMKEIAPISFMSIRFKDTSTNLWYELGSTMPEFTNLLKSNSVRLKTLTIKEAEEIDRARDLVEKARPQVTVTSLDKISATKRLLPGDLTSYKFKASAIFSSPKKGTESTCDSFDETALNTDCLVEKYDGFKISFFQQIESPESKSKAVEGEGVSIMPVPGYASGNMEFIVLDKPLKDVKTLLEKVQNSSQYGGWLNNKSETTIVEKNGKTVIVLGGTDQKMREAVIANTRIDNGIETLKSQLSEQMYSISSDQGRSAM